MRSFLLVCSLFVLTISLAWGQSDNKTAYNYGGPQQFLLDHAHLRQVQETTQYAGTEYPRLVDLYTIDRAKREINVKYTLHEFSSVQTGLFRYDEQWRLVEELTYSEEGEKMYQAKYTYLSDGGIVAWSKFPTSNVMSEDIGWITYQDTTRFDSTGLEISTIAQSIEQSGTYAVDRQHRYSYDDEGRVEEKITLEKDSLQNKYLPMAWVNFTYQKNKRTQSFFNAKTNTNTESTSWFKDDLLVRTKKLDLNTKVTTNTYRTYENGLLSFLRIERKTPRGTFEDWHSYSYE